MADQAINNLCGRDTNTRRSHAVTKETGRGGIPYEREKLIIVTGGGKFRNGKTRYSEGSLGAGAHRIYYHALEVTKAWD